MGLAKGHGEFRDKLKGYLLQDGAQPAYLVQHGAMEIPSFLSALLKGLLLSGEL